MWTTIMILTIVFLLDLIAFIVISEDLKLIKAETKIMWKERLDRMTERAVDKFYQEAYKETINNCCERLDSLENKVDKTKSKVKITKKSNNKK